MCAGNQSISRFIASTVSVSEARYCLLQRPIWRSIVAGPPVVGKPGSFDVDRVQLRENAVHLVIDRGALVALEARQRLIPEDATVDVLHDVERPANDAFVLDQQQRPRHWYALRCQCAHHVEFALDRMRRGQQFRRRSGLAAHHVLRGRRRDQVGGVGLTALELLYVHRPAKLGQVPLQVDGETFNVEGVPSGHCAKLGHANPPGSLRRARSFR
jgi:hypothetical protein